MAKSKRLMIALTRNDLEHLKELSLKEHDAFFERNSHLRTAYYGSLIGICLCQGAASHYLDPKVGVADWDIWHFYIEDRKTNFPYRAHKRIDNGYRGKSVDFLKRAISKEIYDSCSSRPERTIMKYLLERNTKTKRKLLEKAIIGLYPNALLGRVLWKGEL